MIRLCPRCRRRIRQQNHPRKVQRRRLPTLDGLDFSGLDLSQDEIATLLKVDVEGWMSEIPLIESYYESFGDHVPEALWQELQSLKEQLESAKVGVA